MYQEIETTILEFLPLAYFLYWKNDWEKYLELPHDSPCPFLNPNQQAGGCTIYPYRSLICRLFGFSTRQNKLEQLELVTCHLIKDKYSEHFFKTETQIQQGLMIAPSINQYHWRLYDIDMFLASQFYPITQAIQKALEIVAFDQDYRRPA